MKKSEPPVVIEQTVPGCPDEVWKAITDPDRMRKWFFPQIPGFKPEPGFETRFEVESGGRIFPHVWKVTGVDPGRKISYDWSYEGYQGRGNVHFSIAVRDGSTVLSVTFGATEDFPEDIPEFARESCEKGWSYLIGESLPEYLGG